MFFPFPAQHGGRASPALYRTSIPVSPLRKVKLVLSGLFSWGDPGHRARNPSVSFSSPLYSPSPLLSFLLPFSSPHHHLTDLKLNNTILYTGQDKRVLSNWTWCSLETIYWFHHPEWLNVVSSSPPLLFLDPPLNCKLCVSVPCSGPYE